MKTKLVEQRNFSGAYDMTGTQIIIDTDKHGRLLLTECFAGMDSIHGGAYRWRHGYAVKLQDGDTFALLESMPWNDLYNRFEIMMDGYDPERPVLDWPGYIIDKTATKATKQQATKP